MSRLCVAALAALCVAALPAVADAATPVQLAPAGSTPVVAVDAQGAGHVAWLSPDDNSIGYCTLARGATVCTHSRTLTAPGTSLGGLNIFLHGTTIEVFADLIGCDSTGGVYRWAFTEGGPATGSCKTASSGPGSGTLSPTEGQGTLDSGDRFIASGPGQGRAVAHVVASFPAGTAARAQDPPFVFPDSAAQYYDASVATALTESDPTPVGALGVAGSTTDGSGDDVAVFTANERGASTAMLNDPSNWSPPVTVPGTADSEHFPVLVGDHSLYAIDGLDHENAHDAIMIARVVRTPNAAIAASDEFTGGDSDVDITDARAATSDDGIDLTWQSDGRLRYANSGGASDDEGADMTLRGTIVASTGGYHDPSLGVAVDGQGFDVWQQDKASGTGPGPIVAVPLTATADPADSPPAGGQTPTPTPPTVTPPAVTPPATTPKPSPSPSPPTSKPTTKTTTSTVAGGSVSLGVPRGCVAPGKTFTVTLGFRRSTRKGANFVKVTKVVFSVNTKTRKTDRKAPFRQTLRVTASAKPGSRLTVRARATIKVHHGRAPKKSIHTTITVCG